MKRFLILIAAFIFLSLPALAEERIDLSTNGNDQLNAYALPDGRTIFAGSASTKGNYQDSRARLLCMNSDGTIAWDYLHPAKGNCSFGNVQLLPDGTLGVIFRNSPNQDTKEVLIFKFSLDGQIIGEPVSIYTDDILVSGVTEDCISYVVIPGDAQSYYRYFVDWEGNILFRLHSESTISGGFEMIPADDGVVLAGSDLDYPSPAKIVKLDLYGNVLWAKTLQPTLPEAHADLSNSEALADGGFVARLFERSEASGYGSNLFIVRFSHDGSILWQQSLSDEYPKLRQVKDIIAYGDYIVVAIPSESYHGDKPYSYLWLDAKTGKIVGTTEHMMTPALTNYGGDFVVLDNGLWIKRDLRKNIENDRMAELDSGDEVLVKVPEI